jgi:hypothetical protein
MQSRKKKDFANKAFGHISHPIEKFEILDNLMMTDG